MSNLQQSYNAGQTRGQANVSSLIPFLVLNANINMILVIKYDFGYEINVYIGDMAGEGRAMD